MSFAFPGSMDSGGGYDPGMTLRDYFAIYAVLSAASYHGGFVDGVIGRLLKYWETKVPRT